MYIFFCDVFAILNMHLFLLNFKLSISNRYFCRLITIRDKPAICRCKWIKIGYLVNFNCNTIIYVILTQHSGRSVSTVICLSIFNSLSVRLDYIDTCFCFRWHLILMLRGNNTHFITILCHLGALT